MEILKINNYLSFVLENTRNGYKINCIYDGQSIGHKNACRHIQCVVKFISEMTLAAEQMNRFEKIFETELNLN
jgi:hypothetical protein